MGFCKRFKIKLFSFKVVTLCGLVRLWNKIQEMSERLELVNEYAK